MTPCFAATRRCARAISAWNGTSGSSNIATDLPGPFTRGQQLVSSARTTRRPSAGTCRSRRSRSARARRRAASGPRRAPCRRPAPGIARSTTSTPVSRCDNRRPARAVLAADAGGDGVAEHVQPLERPGWRVGREVVRQLDPDREQHIAIAGAANTARVRNDDRADSAALTSATNVTMPHIGSTYGGNGVDDSPTSSIPAAAAMSHPASIQPIRQHVREADARARRSPSRKRIRRRFRGG